jgi:hypothetical protein
MSLKNPVTPPGFDPGTIRLVAQRLNLYATTGPDIYASVTKLFFISAINIVYYVPFISFRTSGSIWIAAGTIHKLSFPTLII